MMDDLTRRRLEFAGLHRNEPTGGFWWDSENNLVFDFHNPEERGFDDLNACITHIVPKLDIFELWQEDGVFAVAKVGIAPGEPVTAVEEIRGNPMHSFATAFCGAIDKLIGQEEARKRRVKMSDWKDTVMSDEQQFQLRKSLDYSERSCWGISLAEKVAKAQAEITWKPAFKAGIEQGRQEVVEAVERIGLDRISVADDVLERKAKEWQTKLREWEVGWMIIL